MPETLEPLSIHRWLTIFALVALVWCPTAAFAQARGLGDPADTAAPGVELHVETASSPGEPSPAETVGPVIGLILGGLLSVGGGLALVPVFLLRARLDQDPWLAITWSGLGALPLGILSFCGSLAWLDDISSRRRRARRAARTRGRAFVAPTADGALAGVSLTF